MNIKRLAGIAILIFIFIIGCSGNYGKLIPQSESDSKVTQRELIDNWSDYNIWPGYFKWFGGGPGGAGPGGAWLALIVFDPKNDDRKILVGSSWGKVKDQEIWTEIVKTKTTSDGDFSLVFADYDYRTTGVQEIWGSDNQLYGFIIYQQTMVDSVDVKLVDENTMQLSWQRGLRTGSPL